MYQINYLNRNVLITEGEVLLMTELESADAANIRGGIIIAEERFIRPVICKDLYEDFRNQKNVEVTQANISTLTQKVNELNTGDDLSLKPGMIVNAIELVTDEWYQKLWKEYLWKICAECVMYVSTPTRWVQSREKGEMLNAPRSLAAEKDAVSADLKDVRWKMDKILQDRIDPMLTAMREWLCDNKDHFLKFNCYKCPGKEGEHNGTLNSRKTGWVHGIYKDDDDQRGRDWDD